MTVQGRDEVRESGPVAEWVHGWAVSRAVPEVTEVPGGWRLPVGLRGHRVRYVVRATDDAVLAALGREQAVPGTWIKVAGATESLRAALPAGWTMADTYHLMTTPFTGGAAVPPEPYAVRVGTAGEVVVATVLDAAGGTAASGRLAPAGPVGVVDQVETAPGHRRRGLGGVVMRTLADQAVRLGLHRGVLVATDEGRALYRSLGWTVRGPIAGAYVPETGPV